MHSTSLQRIFDAGSWLWQTPEFKILMDAFNKDYQKFDIDDEEISFKQILNLTNFDYAIDCTSTREDLHMVWRAYALKCAILLQEYITEAECKNSFVAASLYLENKITKEQLKAAYDKAFVANLHHGFNFNDVEYAANAAATTVANPDLDSCVKDTHMSTGLGLLHLNIESVQVDRILLDIFIEILDCQP